MGITHKLIPQIKEYILEQKKADPRISCRSLSELIEQKFQIKVSKSSINAIFKESGLSMPVGRSSEGKRKLSIEAPELLERKEPVELLSAPEPEPAVERIVEPVIEKAQEPIIEKAPEPVIEKIPEPVIEKVPEPVIEKIPEPVVEKIPKPVIEKVPEPTVEKIPQPIENIPEPVAEKPTEPETITPAAAAKERVFKELEKVALTETTCSGALFLKAADDIIGGSYAIGEIIKKRLSRSDDNLSAETQALFFMPLFSSKPEDLEPITGIKIAPQELDGLIQEINSVKILTADITRVISNCLEEARGLKLSLSDGSAFYLDGQMHSIWSTPHIPYDFSSTVTDIKRVIDDCFFARKPLVLFMAPGYETPSKELFSFTAGLECQDKKILRLTFCGNKFEDMDTVSIDDPKKYYYIFGAWPWQFVGARKVRKIGEFKAYLSEALKKEVFAAELDIDLLDQNKQPLNFKGCAIKLSATEKTRLIVLSNLPGDRATPQLLSEAYLSRWPNLEEAFQDYSRKIELFTYTADSQAFFSSDYFGLESDSTPRELNNIIDNYLKTLDAYLKWHLLPQGYEKETFETAKSRFYDLPASIKKDGDCAVVTFSIPQGYAFLKDLQYLCRRLNERKARLSSGLRLHFNA
jgi:hypothetical protein